MRGLDPLPSVVLIASAALAFSFAFVPAKAVAACGGVLATLGLQPECPPPPSGGGGVTYPDPGGADSPDQPIPVPGKVFGLNGGLYFQDMGTLEQELDPIEAVGSNSVRVVVHWRTFQPRQSTALPPATGEVAEGSPAWKLDRFYESAVARGITPVFIPYVAPLWATRYKDCPLLDFGCEQIKRSHHALVPEPSYLGHYAEFVRAVKARWPRALIEPWNEPDVFWGDPNYTGSRAFPASPEYYKAMQCAAYEASKSVNDGPVLSAGWSMIRGAEYVRRVHAAGGADCWDIANVHAYPAEQTKFAGDSSIAYVFHLFRGIREQYADTDPIWVTETGYTTSGNLAVSEAVQAEASGRLYNRLITMEDVEGVFFYTLRDAPVTHWPYTDPTSSEYGRGFLRGDWAPKPVHCHFARRAGTPAC